MSGAPRRGRAAQGRTKSAAAEPRFHTGDSVRVRAADPPGHVRTPHYARGHCGIIDANAGAFANPEELAYGRSGGPPVPLYRVRFEQSALWPDYDGAPHDTIVVDIYEHWLEPAPAATTRTAGTQRRAQPAKPRSHKRRSHRT